MEKIQEVEEKDRIRTGAPRLRGRRSWLRAGIPPGRTVGLLKRAIEEAILDGRIPNEHDAALAYLHSIKSEIPPKNARIYET